MKHQNLDVSQNALRRAARPKQYATIVSLNSACESPRYFFSNHPESPNEEIKNCWNPCLGGDRHGNIISQIIEKVPYHDLMIL